MCTTSFCLTTASQPPSTSLIQSFIPSQHFKLGEGPKGTKAQYDSFFDEMLPTHLGYLEKLCAKGTGFAAPSPGGLFLFSVLFQVLLVQKDALPEDRYPTLAAWYAATLANETTQKVLNGESSHGEFLPYFVAAE